MFLDRDNKFGLYLALLWLAGLISGLTMLLVIDDGLRLLLAQLALAALILLALICAKSICIIYDGHDAHGGHGDAG